MKKHLVVVCGVLYPNASATGICTQRYMELLTKEYDIDVICMASDNKLHEAVLPSGIQVYALAGGTLAAEASCNGFAKRGWHLLGQIQIKLHWLGNLRWFADAAAEKLEQLHKEKPFDAVFSVCSPMAAHCAAHRFRNRHPQVHWTAYTVDYYATPQRIRPYGVTHKHLVQWELETLQAADSVLLSEEIYGNHPEIVRRLSAVKALPYLLPEPASCGTTEELLPTDRINCVFAGSFYADIRNPEPMLQTFSGLQEEGICLHLFSTGCEELVQKYADGRKIIWHGRVPYDTIQSVYRQADVLINIGNANSDFLPSKTYEYIAYGKPIVNFFYGEKPDAVLSRYPAAFSICNAVGGEVTKGLVQFVKQNVGLVLTRDNIEKIYRKNEASAVKSVLIQQMEK